MFMDFLVVAILTGVKWYFIIVWFAFLCKLVMLDIFLCSHGHLYVFFEEMPI